MATKQVTRRVKLLAVVGLLLLGGGFVLWGLRSLPADPPLEATSEVRKAILEGIRDPELRESLKWPIVLKDWDYLEIYTGGEFGDQILDLRGLEGLAVLSGVRSLQLQTGENGYHGDYPSEPFRDIPGVELIGQLPELEALSLPGNWRVSLEDLEGCADTLTSLNISGKCVTVPDGFCEFVKLENLILSGPLVNAQKNQDALDLSCLTHLKWLTIKGPSDFPVVEVRRSGLQLYVDPSADVRVIYE